MWYIKNKELGLYLGLSVVNTQRSDWCLTEFNDASCWSLFWWAKERLDELKKTCLRDPSEYVIAYRGGGS